MKKLLTLLLTLALLCSCQAADKPSANGTTENTPSPIPNINGNQPVDIKHVADVPADTREFDLKQFSEKPDDRPWDVGYCGGNTVCVSYRRGNEDKYIRIIDLGKNKIVGSIDVPKDYHLYVRDYFIDFAWNNGGEGGQSVSDYKRIILSPDGSYEWVEGELNYSLSPVTRFGSHGVYEDFGSIYDADTKSIIIERYKEEGDMHGASVLNYHFMFPLDDDRFVYQVDGYEKMPAFGIYDFSTGRAIDIPESRNMMPMGVCDGKILSHEAYWDGYGTKLFVTNPETLETLLLCEPFESTEQGHVEFTLPDDMEYICACYTSDDWDAPLIRLVLLNPETGDVVSRYSMESNCESPFFTDDYIFFKDPTEEKLCLIMDRE